MTDQPTSAPSSEPTPTPEKEVAIRDVVAGMTAPKARTTKRRVSGKTAANEEAEKSAEEATEPVEENVIPEEREEWFKSPGFQRMKTSWTGDDKRQMDRVQVVIDRTVMNSFPEVYVLMNDLYNIVREHEVDPFTGEIRTDEYGQPIWVRDPLTGGYSEDWSALTQRERESFLFRIVTALFDWEQRAADLWTKAMFSKAMFTESFAVEYDAPMRGTIEDRTARGNVKSAEERYFALMNSAVSKKADALVRSMTTLQLRLKDMLGSA